jgi:ribonuclease P protein component
MLPKQNRLKTKSEFDRVYKHGKKLSTPYFLVIIASQKTSNLKQGQSLPRFGFVASKKVGKAVQRNRAKRLLREIVRKEFPLLSNSFEAVIVSFESMNNVDFQELTDAIKSSFYKLNLYKNKSTPSI